MPARGVVISFSIFIASTTQTTWPASTCVAFGDLDREHCALHRRDDRVAGSAVMTALRVAVAPSPRQLRVRRLRLEELDLEAAALDLCLDDVLSKPSVRRRRYACCLMRQLLRTFGQLLRLGDAVARLARREARVTRAARGGSPRAS